MGRGYVCGCYESGNSYMSEGERGEFGVTRGTAGSRRARGSGA